MGCIAPSTFAGHDISCPYEDKPLPAGDGGRWLVRAKFVCRARHAVPLRNRLPFCLFRISHLNTITYATIGFAGPWCMADLELGSDAQLYGGACVR